MAGGWPSWGVGVFNWWSPIHVTLTPLSDWAYRHTAIFFIIILHQVMQCCRVMICYSVWKIRWHLVFCGSCIKRKAIRLKHV